MLLPDLLLGTAALLLLVLPGWMAARAFHLPVPLLAGFMSGAVGLVLLAQLLEVTGLGLSAGTVFGAWALALAGAALLARRARPPAGEATTRPADAIDWLMLAPVLPAIAVVAYRAVAQPLFGADTVFRWNFLAEQMLARGTLAFYPPVSGSDYAIYGWPDGIAPVVSSLYYWAYALAHAARPALTAPVVIAQFLLILAATHALARRLDSSRAGAVACALVAGSPIVLWGAAMGQETGLLVLSLLGLLLYLPAAGERAAAPAMVLAGVAAALGGLAREYGLAFMAFGLALGWARRLPRCQLAIFFGVAVLGVLPWYARNWSHTGNPFFNLDVAGLFSVNHAHLRLMQIYQGSYGWGHLPPEAGRQFAANCCLGLAAGLAGILAVGRRVPALLVALGLVLILWATAVGYTAAGFTYSLRVLAPGLAVAAVMGGLALARWIPGKRSATVVALALWIFAIDAALRALVLPGNIYKTPPAAWLTVGNAIHDYHEQPVFQQITVFTRGQRVLVLGPAALLTHLGAHTLPLWSPEVAYLWDAAVLPADAARHLARDGIGFVLFNREDVNRTYLAQIPFFRNPGDTLRPIWGDSDMVLFQVNAPAPPAAGGGQPR